MDNDYLTKDEFNKFVNNHFHTLTLKVATLAGGQKVVILLLTALIGLVAVAIGVSVVK